MTYGNIKGDVKSINHATKIAIHSFQFGVIKQVKFNAHSDGIPSVGNPQNKEIAVLKTMCGASPQLMEYSYTRKPSKCVIELTQSMGNGAFGSSTTERVYAVYELEDAFISEYHIDSYSKEPATERLKINFSKISLKYIHPEEVSAGSSSTKYDFITHQANE